MKARRSFNEQNPGDNFTNKAPIPIAGSSFSRRYSNTGIVNNGSVDSNNNDISSNSLLSSSNHSNFMNSYKRRSSVTSGSFNNSGGGSFNNKLSVSTSPQIPKNLLKLVEMRRQKKKSSIKDKEKQFLQQQQQQQQQQQHHKHSHRQNNHINEEDEDNAIEDDSYDYTDHTVNSVTNNIRRLSILPDFSVANKDNDSAKNNSNIDLNLHDKSHSNLTKEIRQHNADEGSGNTNVGIGNENSNNDITKTSSTTTVDNTGSTSNAEAISGL
ncbi:unnamed protein product [[Candida] boidinii]|nr:unnamed protein product [[Candida] boidinii]